MGELGRLIEGGAQADELAEDLLRHVDRWAIRAHKIDELEVKRDSVVSLTELAVVFGTWIELLGRELAEEPFRKLLPRAGAAQRCAARDRGFGRGSGCGRRGPSGRLARERR